MTIALTDIRALVNEIFATAVKAVSIADQISLKTLSKDEGSRALDRVGRELRVVADYLKDAAYEYRREGFSR